MYFSVSLEIFEKIENFKPIIIIKETQR